jgi:exopolysaccharide biosynthesis polyprenyl glycosylphosphotransferase
MVPTSTSDSVFLTEEAFIRRLHLEQRRTERSRRPFVLLLLEAGSLLKAGQKPKVCERIVEVLSTSTRETDLRGWYEEGSAIGVIFTEVDSAEGASIGNALVTKIRRLLSTKLSAHQMALITLSFYVFPEDWDKGSRDGSTAAALYPDSVRAKKASQLVKRCVDIGGSLAAIVIASPAFLAIAALIKLTSKGPVLFRQDRVGQYGRKFTFLKFRSMYVNNDSAIHREYITNLIAGTVHSKVDSKDASKGVSNGASGPKQKVYKLTNDPRVTRIGGFLRKTSFDELPQFLNVLWGEMSLVGPRPPIPYEVENYDIWHRRRLLGVKPGITGLWQVTGRSRTTFDEMVRLDLQYAKSWSLWLDLKILLQTPRAVVAGDGAY